MQAKCRQSWSMTVTADDTEFAADAPTPTGKERCSSPVTSARRHHPQTTHLPVSTASSQVAAAVSRRCLHAAGSSATAIRPAVRTSPPAAWRRRSHSSVNLYAGVKIWMFSTSK